MKTLRHAFAVFLLIAVYTPNVNASHDHDFEPLDGVSHLVAWFRQLNDHFDNIVENEKKAQLLRVVDRLRKSLYELEVDARFLIDSIPTDRPDEKQLVQIDGFVEDLLRTVSRLRENLREIGADLRLADQTERLEAEDRLSAGLRTRGIVLTELQRKLLEVRRGVATWRPDTIRTRLRVGLNAVKDAQIAITEFQRKLATSD